EAPGLCPVCGSPPRYHSRVSAVSGEPTARGVRVRQHAVASAGKKKIIGPRASDQPPRALLQTKPALKLTRASGHVIRIDTACAYRVTYCAAEAEKPYQRFTHLRSSTERPRP